VISAKDLQSVKTIRYTNRDKCTPSEQLSKHKVVLPTLDIESIETILLPRFQQTGLCFVSVKQELNISQFEKLIPYFGESVHQKKQNEVIGNLNYLVVRVIEGSRAAGLTDRDQSMHMDGIYHEDLPGIMVPHCAQQADFGGDSIFADGLEVYKFLQQVYPKGLKVLLDNPEALEFHLPFQGGGIKKFSLFNRLPSGKISFFYTPYALSICGNVEAEKTFALVTQFVHNSQNQIKYKMSEKSDFVLLDNSRYTHGRYAFSGSKQRMLNRVWFTGTSLDLGFTI
jgi:alpha-ketoglutarate-dependent taurine dioxygenase